MLGAAAYTQKVTEDRRHKGSSAEMARIRFLRGLSLAAMTISRLRNGLSLFTIPDVVLQAAVLRHAMLEGISNPQPGAAIFKVRSGASGVVDAPLCVRDPYTTRQHNTLGGAPVVGLWGWLRKITQICKSYNYGTSKADPYISGYRRYSSLGYAKAY